MQTTMANMNRNSPLNKQQTKATDHKTHKKQTIQQTKHHDKHKQAKTNTHAITNSRTQETKTKNSKLQ